MTRDRQYCTGGMGSAAVQKDTRARAGDQTRGGDQKKKKKKKKKGPGRNECRQAGALVGLVLVMMRQCVQREDACALTAFVRTGAISKEGMTPPALVNENMKRTTISKSSCPEKKLVSTTSHRDARSMYPFSLR